MTASEIIGKFELYVDDTTELSSTEELALCNKIYNRVCEMHLWEFLKKEASGTMASTTTITVPSDFSHFIENRNETSAVESSWADARKVGILINGTTWLQVINWSDRKQYTNASNYAYYDAANNAITTTYAQPASATYSFDYKAFPTALITSTSPVFPARFHDILVHGMAVDDMIVQLFEKARSYAPENQAMFNSYLSDMRMWNSNLLMN